MSETSHKEPDMKLSPEKAAQRSSVYHSMESSLENRASWNDQQARLMAERLLDEEDDGMDKAKMQRLKDSLSRYASDAYYLKEHHARSRADSDSFAKEHMDELHTAALEEAKSIGVEIKEGSK